MKRAVWVLAFLLAALSPVAADDERTLVVVAGGGCRGGGFRRSGLGRWYRLAFPDQRLHHPPRRLVAQHRQHGRLLRDLDIPVGDYDFNPRVSNAVLRNALMMSVPSTLGDRKVTTEFWGIDTRFFGSELHSEYYDEVGISFGLDLPGNLARR